MAASLLSPFSAPSTELLAPTAGLPKSSFLSSTNLLFSTANPLNQRAAVQRRCYTSPSASGKPFDRIPQRFRQENLIDGLMENYQNVPRQLYGLSPSQMDMFMTEDNPIRRQSERVTEESISSRCNYLDHGGMYTTSGMTDMGPAKYSMSVSMYRGGGGRGGIGRPRSAPPDLPSLLLDARICYLGMPPIYLYINSTGTQNEKMETVGSETEAFAIADAMAYCKSTVYTVNCGMAYGQAAMLLSLGAKAKLYLPKVNGSSGSVIDMWIKAKELDANTDYYIELLAKGTGKSKEEINKDVRRPKYLNAQEAIEYGLADKLVDSSDDAFQKRDYDALLAQSKAMRAAAAGPRAAPTRFG
ncbi:unnamed protein product [Linum tenue]|uniref:ATP-dependent Clp protease proteolytic subunit n=1 Tax=Linum tenue TaxID=586396 RepID=A0AAV0PM70_9ROSI|nr:unnamed protein product [Linum tenue]